VIDAGPKELGTLLLLLLHIVFACREHDIWIWLRLWCFLVKPLPASHSHSRWNHPE
jgi:hypothetical protein